jgi:hypothetical protein
MHGHGATIQVPTNLRRTSSGIVVAGSIVGLAPLDIFYILLS